METNPYPAGRDSLIRFSILTDKRYSPNWHHKIVAQELERLAEDVANGYPKQIFLILTMPPRHGKSQEASINFPAYFLGKSPEKEIITSSYSEELATDFGSSTRTMIQSPEYQQIFNTKLKEDDKAKGKWKTKEGGGYTSVGVGGSVTGRGADIFIIDDPLKNREEAESVVVREKVWNWFTSTAFTRLSPSGAMVFIMTRWNVEDLVGRVLETYHDYKGVEIRQVNFPAIAEEDEFRDDKLLRRKGEALWPDRYGVEALNTKREVIGERDWSALYQQDPIRSSGQTFKKEDFRYFALSDLAPSNFEVGVFVDPAFSTRTESDETGIGVIARHKTTKELYVLDILGDTILPSQAYGVIVSLYEKWKSAGWTMAFISVEDVSISKDQQIFLDGLRQFLRDQGKFYTLLPFKPQGRGKKEERIKYSLEPVFTNHALHFRSDEPQNKSWRHLEEQLMKFPVSRRDDLIDIVSQGAIVWSERVPKKPGNYNQNKPVYI